MVETQKKQLWHLKSVEEIISEFGTSVEKGLTSQKVNELRQQYGRNVFKEEEKVSFWKIIIKEINSPLIYLLLAAALISVLTSHYTDAMVILIVIALNTTLGVTQEWRAEKALEAIKHLGATKARVLRDGKEQKIQSAEIVPGDILLLGLGDNIAADARLIESQSIQTNESSLTGESETVNKNPVKFETEKVMAEQENMVWMSTAVTAGHGKAVVVATGMDTAMGEIAGKVRDTKREKTPLQKRLDKMATLIGIAGISLATGLFFLGLINGYALKEMLLFSVAVAVSAIPEGLPAVISITLALGVKRLAKKNTIVRNLPSVETLGSTTFICVDKTGTITENEMTVTKIWSGEEIYETSGLGYNPEGKIIETKSGQEINELSPELQTLMQIGCLNNDSKLLQFENQWIVEGSPTEGAILVSAVKAGFNIYETSNQYLKTDEIAFSSERKYMAGLFQKKDSENTVIYFKGAPEKIIELCSHYLKAGQKVELNEENLEKLRQVSADFAGKALRVIAGAYVENKVRLDEKTLEKELTLAGLWGIIDPPRKEVAFSVKKAQAAGINIVMITGDNPVTAAAIAIKVGIATEKSETITGKELDSMTDEQLAEKVKTIRIFARVTPSHKLKILNSLKKTGQIVAMTGDGVNDAPALKGADIGIAMGKKGTEVAREAADMILTDDNFATIINAIEEGRVIFSNLRRVVFYLLTTNLGEIILLTVALLLGIPLPLTAVMILWVNLITDGPSDISLGVEPKHSDVLNHPPRHPEAGILNKALIYRIIVLSSIMAVGTLSLYYYYLQNFEQKLAMTVAFTTTAAFQWFHAFNSRSSTLSVASIGLFSNRWLLVGITTAIIAQLGAVYTAFGQNTFNIVALSLKDWFLIIITASSILITDEICKKLKVYRRFGNEYTLSDNKVRVHTHKKTKV